MVMSLTCMGPKLQGMGYENNRNKRKEIEANAESEWKLRETEGESPLLGKGEWRGKM